MRKSLLILTLGLFFSVSAANACDGGKTCTMSTKGKKAVASKTTKAKSSCDMKSAKCTMKPGTCDMKAMATGKKDCCKAKASATPKAETAPKS